MEIWGKDYEGMNKLKQKWVCVPHSIIGLLDDANAFSHHNKADIAICLFTVTLTVYPLLLPHFVSSILFYLLPALFCSSPVPPCFSVLCKFSCYISKGLPFFMDWCVYIGMHAAQTYMFLSAFSSPSHTTPLFYVYYVSHEAGTLTFYYSNFNVK